jgi:hypothetical protein
MTSAPTPHFLAFAIPCLLSAASCSSEEERDLGNPVTANPCEIPVDNLDALTAWLSDENYLAWTAESAIHDGAGPHFGNVRTWLSDELIASLEQNMSSYPLCSATVKELYGTDEQRGGFSVSVKVAEDGTSSDWFWFEIYESEVLAFGTDVSVCVNCHSAGTDYLLSPYPLR